MLKNISILVFFVLVILTIGQALLDSRFPYTHDGESHLARFANYKLALKEGQLPPRWGPNLQNYHGYPVFNYNYPLANIVSLPFSAIGISYEVTFKLQVFFVLSMGALAAWQWLKLRKASRSARMIAVTAWLTAPAIFSAITFRGSIGEIWTYGLIPVLFYSIEYSISKILKKQKISIRHYLVLMLSLTAFLLSHNISVLIWSVFLLLYLVLNYRGSLLLIIRALWAVPTTALGASLWFWLPAIVELDKIVLRNVELSKLFFEHFPTLQQLIFSPYSAGFSYPGPVDGMSFMIGFPFVVAVLYVLIAFVANIFQEKNNSINHWVLSSASLAVLLIILQQPIFSEFWKLTGLYQFVQFPWRLSLFIPILLLPTMVWMWDRFAYSSLIKILLIMSVLLNVSMVWQARPADYFSKENIDYDAFSDTTSTQHENRTPEFHDSVISEWQQEPIVLSGNAQFSVERWTGSRKRYQATVTETSVIIEPTMRFLGWQTLITPISGVQYQAQYLESEEHIKGRIAYLLEPGTYSIDSQFTQRTTARIIGNSVSLLSIVGFTFWLMRKKRT